MRNTHIIEERDLGDEARAYVAMFGLLTRDATPSTPEDVEAYHVITAKTRDLVTRDLSALGACL